MENIPPEECLALLATAGLGRLAYGRGADPPVVLPVNYAIDGATIVFRSDRGTKLRRLNRAVSFQVDAVDPIRRIGWSVLVHGTFHEVEVHEVEHLDLEPWVGERRHWLRIVPTSMTGRRIVLTDFDPGDRGYL